MLLIRTPYTFRPPVGQDATIRSMVLCLALLVVLIGAVSLVFDRDTTYAQRSPNLHEPSQLTPFEGLQRVGSWATDGMDHDASNQTRATHASDSGQGSITEALRRIGDWAMPVSGSSAIATRPKDVGISESLRRIGDWTTAPLP